MVLSTQNSNFLLGEAGVENGLTELPEIHAPSLDSPLSERVSSKIQPFLLLFLPLRLGSCRETPGAADFPSPGAHFARKTGEILLPRKSHDQQS
jgi:hypothetical protein